ncbi:uncharacterized protein LOC141701709 [Apium graveolens]|uniref:uncharacterized protein LOC141701709 n=1 Tax=Apium graveolens TaxID=4045 RepID=UPI003D7B51BA
MAEDMEIYDDILDLACDCNRLSVVKTRWYGENAGRRFRECAEEECGYHKWVDPPFGPRAVAVIEELQESIAEQVHRSGRRIDRLIEKHQTEMNNVKKKQEFTVIAMFVLFSLMMNMVLGAVGQEAVVEDGGYSFESD